MLHYNDSGGDGRLNVLLLHGLGADADSWHFQWADLSGKGYRLIAPDLPGFGRSPAEDGRWTIRSSAEQVTDLMSHLSLSKYVVAGISMGGTIALSMARFFPEKIGGLILINTFASMKPKRVSEWRYFVRRGMRAFLLSPSDQARIVAERVFPGSEQAFFRDLLVTSIQNTNPKVYRQAMLELARFNEIRSLPKITMPTLVVTGAEDTTIPLDNQKAMANLIPGARQIVIPHAGHGVTADQPEVFNRCVSEFLQQIQVS